VSGRRSSLGAARSWLAAAVTAVSLATLVIALVAMLGLVSAGVADGSYAMFAILSLGAGYTLVGWLIASRRPDNAMGWVLLAIGLSAAAEALAVAGASYGTLPGATAVPFTAELAWLSSWAWAPAIGLLATLSLLLYPDGHLPSRRWLPVAWASVVMLFLLVVPVAVIGWPQRSVDLLQNSDGGPGQNIGFAMFAVLAVASVASLVVRFRRSSGQERLQLKWFTWTAIPFIAFVIVITVLSPLLALPPIVLLCLAVFVMPLLPVSIGIAILRYRLYEIDRIVSRTLGWAVVTGLLVAVFALGVIALQALLAGLTQGQTLAVAGSTLVAFALFQPLRRRVQRAVDRRFDRARYDGDRLAREFVERLRHETDLDAARSVLVTAAGQAMQPRSAALWIRERAR